MSRWKTMLNADPIDWLLEDENPSIRYFTLTKLLGKSEGTTEVKSARKAIMKTGDVPKIMSEYNKGGYWVHPDDFYMRTQYKGTVWTLILLALLGADGNDKRIQKAVENFIKLSQHRDSGGFAYVGSAKNGGQGSKTIPCLTGNAVYFLIKFGYLNDPRVSQGIKFITTHQRFDDGIAEKPTGWPYDHMEQCWGRHTCHMGVIKYLNALAEIPPRNRTKAVKKTIKEGAEYLLKHRIYKSSRNPDKVAKAKWVKFRFPRFWHIDALEMLGTLTSLGFKDKRMGDAIELVLSKQNDDGTWNLNIAYPGKLHFNLEKGGKPSKWITYYCCRVLKEYYK